MGQAWLSNATSAAVEHNNPTRQAAHHTSGCSAACAVTMAACALHGTPGLCVMLSACLVASLHSRPPTLDGKHNRRGQLPMSFCMPFQLCPDSVHLADPCNDSAQYSIMMSFRLELNNFKPTADQNAILVEYTASATPASWARPSAKKVRCIQRGIQPPLLEST